jgi:microcompartment protein CcmK/EutM
MDIEELSKSQTVLLVILVSFVTSMATGIVTVALMEQAPTSVAQTVNRVIQQTIKEVVSPGQTAAATVPKPIVVKQSDEIASAVQKSLPSTVRLYSDDGTTFLGMGVVLDSSGTIVTDLAALAGSGRVSVVTSSGVSSHAVVTTRNTADGTAFMTVATSSATSTPTLWSPIAIASTGAALGETVILLAGESSPWVGSGLVSSIQNAPDGLLPLVKTDISGDNVIYGSPLIDTSGTLVGISTQASRSINGTAFLSVAAISADLVSMRGVVK